jgi:hypothetical protein
MKKEKEKNIIEIQKDTKIGDVVLEKGDKIEVIEEEVINLEELISEIKVYLTQRPGNAREFAKALLSPPVVSRAPDLISYLDRELHP